MIGLHSQLINMDEKMILKDALFLYVSDLQKRYYSDKLVETDVYLAKMNTRIQMSCIKLELYLLNYSGKEGTPRINSKLRYSRWAQS